MERVEVARNPVLGSSSPCAENGLKLFWTMQVSGLHADLKRRQIF